VIQRLLSLERLGVFRDALPHGAVELAKCTLVYGENGRGKTTLSRLLRSLCTGDCGCLRPIATIGVDSPPSARLLSQNTQCSLQNYAWTQALPSMVIFDSEFVNRNVYTGTSVGPDHRRHLCEFVLGEQSVSLAKKVEDLNARIKSVQQEIRDAEKELSGIIGGAMTVAEFVGLAADPDIEARITQKQKLLDAAKDAASVLGRPELQRAEMPPLPSIESLAVLGKTVEDVAADAAARTRQHIEEHLGPEGEAWLRSGMAFLTDEVCPFCGGSVADSDLVAAFAGYFSESYTELVEQVATTADELANTLSHGRLAVCRSAVADNAASAEFWGRYVSVPELQSPMASAEKADRLATELLLHALEGKKAKPLEAVDPGSLLAQARAAHAEADLSTYNAAVDQTNEAIREFKVSVSAGDPVTIAASLRKLRLQKTRWEGRAAGLCQTLGGLGTRKQKLEADKVDAKRQLDECLQDIVSQYQTALNRFLARCNAAFQVTEMKAGFAGGEPRSDYSVELLGHRVSAAAKASDAPHFDTMLSDGDRRTLALAFFLARVSEDPDIAGKIVVLDDPVASLDTHRLRCTVKAIVDLASRCGQLIVMTHNPHLAMEAAAALQAAGYAKSGDLATLHLARDGAWTTIRECDFADLHRTVLQESIDTLERYLDGPGDVSPIEAVRSIRPALEGVLRLKYPREFAGIREVGRMVDAIRDSAADSRVHHLKPCIEELYDVASYYSPTYLHVDRPHVTALPDDAEAVSWVRRALKLLASL